METAKQYKKGQRTRKPKPIFPDLCPADKPCPQSHIYKPKFQGRSKQYDTKCFSSQDLVDENSSSSSLPTSVNSGLDSQEYHSENYIHIQASQMPRIFFCSKIY